MQALLSGVDDRNVITNAGDEMQLRFPAGELVSSGWRRDFVLIGDGWEKDGDYNTEYSSTVTPADACALQGMRPPRQTPLVEADL